MVNGAPQPPLWLLGGGALCSVNINTTKLHQNLFTAAKLLELIVLYLKAMALCHL